MIAAVVIALILINVPIGVAICAAALVGMVWQNGVFGLYNAALALFDGATSFPLIAIPLFILAGALMNTGGISRRLIDFTSALIGFIRGGLAMVNVAVSMFFAEISGSAVADVAAIGSVLMILNVLLLVMGMLLHGAAAIILVVPIVLPLIHLIGIDPVHFGIILTLNLAIGQQTPPVASVLVTSCSIARTEI